MACCVWFAFIDFFLEGQVYQVYLKKIENFVYITSSGLDLQKIVLITDKTNLLNVHNPIKK